MDATPTPLRPSTPTRHSTPYAWYVVFILLLTNVISYIDRKLPFILIESIKRDLHLTDTQIGLVSGLLFTGTYALAGLFIARLADRSSRKLVLAISIAAWSFLTASAGLAQNFVHFACARMGVAVAESGAAPSSQSLISDYFPPAKRGLPMAVYAAGSSLGIMGGMVIGGVINDLSSWRDAMFIVLAPGVVLSLVLTFTIREPARGGSDAPIAAGAPPVSPPSTVRASLAGFWKIRALRLLIPGTAFLSLGGVAITGFAAPFLIRSYGLTTTKVGLLLGGVLGVSGAVSILSAHLVDRWAERDPRLRLWLPAAAYIVAVPLFAAAFFAPTPTGVIILMTLALTCCATYVAPTFATAHGLVRPGDRALLSAVIFVALQGIGGSFGPLLVGMLSDALRPRFGADALRYALLSMLPSFLIGAGLFFGAGALLPRPAGVRANGH